MVALNAIDDGSPALEDGGMDALVERLIERILSSDAFVDRIAQKLDEMFGGSEDDDVVEEEYEAGLGDAYVPSASGDGRSIPSHAKSSGDEGEPVTDDLDEENEEDEDEDMNNSAVAAGQHYNSDCAEETPPRDARRSRQQYAASLAPEIKRLRSDFEAERAKYQKDNETLRRQVAELIADRERTHRTRVLEGLLVEGYELNVDEELNRLERYGRDTFDREINLIRARYKRSEPMSEYLPVSPGGYVPAGGLADQDYSDPSARQAMLDTVLSQVRAASNEGLNSGKPELAGAAFVERYRKNGGNGFAVRG